ncbi:helix-turn-helix transcriptional regulator [Streptacidiphilus jiangxiensis]|uniref:Regulatory protein, luxR family n=1 Tax=Streptacidiphilus jiangxiensis TaxID=235985 RepID=A0A1H7TFJ9_STRJI|nr:LuxR family transcriptional regulator [Streptacidiphilus jiangxiensis]SEL82617.1 regulatory protein, luxR family [Streptacidiphilus jiangxiensis]
MNATAAAVLTEEQPIVPPPGREVEFRRLQEAYDESLRGRGRVVVIHGSVGSGRSELLDAFSGHATRSGALVLHAGGAPLEKSFSYGVVRQLFQSQGLPEDVALSGLRLVGRPAPPGAGAAVELLEGLSSLLLRVAERRPLVLAVDDRQDADRASLEFLVYLVRRTVRAKVLVLLSSRETMTPEHPTIEVELARQRHYQRIRLDLFAPAVVATRLAPVVAPEALGALSTQAYQLTGGNPLLVSALIDDQQPGAVMLDAGENYRRAVMNCLHRIDPLALRCARGIAALGGGTSDLELLADLVLLRRDSLSRGLYLLEASGLLHEGRFRHGTVAGDLLAGVPADELAVLQSRAAELLSVHGASAAMVAEARRAAAGHRQGRQAEIAPTVFRVPGDQAVALLPGSGVAQDRPDVVVIANGTGAGTTESGAQPDLEPSRVASGGAWVTEEGHRPLRALVAAFDSGSGSFTAPASAARAEGQAEDTGARTLQALLAGADPRVIVPRAERVLREGLLGGLAPASLGSALTTLLYADRADRAGHWTAVLAERTREQCGAGWIGILGTAQAETALRLGDPRWALDRACTLLADAEPGTSAEARLVWLTTAIGAATALGRHEQAGDLLDEPTDEDLRGSVAGLRHLLARAEHLLAKGCPEEARALFGDGGHLAAQLGVDQLTGVGLWRVGAARAELAMGRAAAARRLVDEQLGRLGAAGSPRARGLALRARAATAGGAERVASLEQAVAQLEQSGDVVAVGEARAELAEACRAFGDPGRARALERALVGGSSARSHPPHGGGDVFSGVVQRTGVGEQAQADSAGRLSDAEQRVAELAAAGMTNRDISRRLHVTVSTVEQHLTRVYRKLGVRSRIELRTRLAGARELAG